MLKNSTRTENTRGRNGKVVGKNIVEDGFTRISLLSRLIDEEVGKANKENSIKVTLLHSEDESELAKEIVETLNKDSRFRATADCELSIFKMMSFISYLKAAIEWADVVVVLITKRYLEDIKNVHAPIWSQNGSLHAIHGFKLLQHKFYHDNKFPILAAVKEGTNHNCHEFMEFKLCCHLENTYSGLGDVISLLHSSYTYITERRRILRT